MGILGLEVKQQDPDDDLDDATSLQTTTTSRSHTSSAGDKHHRISDAAAKLRVKLGAVAAAAAGGSSAGLGVLTGNVSGLKAKLDEGSLQLSDLEIDLNQALSVGGLLRLMAIHGTWVREYAKELQNILDDCASLVEKVAAAATGQDVIACALFYVAVLCSMLFVHQFGLGMGVYVTLLYLLRPPFLRGVPGVFGIGAFLMNLPSRSADEVT